MTFDEAAGGGGGQKAEEFEAHAGLSMKRFALATRWISRVRYGCGRACLTNLDVPHICC